MNLQRLPKSQIGAIVASILSAIAAGVGFALTIHLGGIGALAGANLTITAVIKLAGATALASGGTSGNYIHTCSKLLNYLNTICLGLVNAVSNGIQGKFSWTDWTKDVGIAVATSLIVFPLAIGGGHMFGNIAMNRLGNLGNGLLIKWGENGSQKIIETCIKVATSAIYSVGQGGMNVVSQCLKDGRINPVAVIVSLAVGAFSGYSIGNSLIDETQIRDFIQEQMRILNGYFQEVGQRPLLPEGVIKALIDHGPGHAATMLYNRT